MLKSTALVVYPVHIVLLNRCALLQRWWVGCRGILVVFLSVKMDVCKDNELSSEGSSDCAHYWVTGTEGVRTLEGMMMLEQGTVRQLKMDWLDDLCLR